MYRRLIALFFIGGFFIFAVSVHAASSVVINEIQTTGAQDADDEFIELWNGSDAAVAVEDWSLQYKTATGTTINKRNFEKGATIPAQEYYLIATKTYTGSVPADLVQSSVSLAKSGGNLFLVRNQEVITSKDDPDIVDRVAWGTGDSAEGNATTVPDAGQSIARDGGADTNNNVKDFSLQTTPTPTNTKTSATTGSAPSSSQSQTTASPTDSTTTNVTSKKESTREEKGTLSITEVLSNPVGSDENEFIELQNTGTAPIALTGWRITNRFEQEYRFTGGTLTPKEYRVLLREKTGLALQNDREEIRLFAPNKDRASEVIKYTDAPEGLSLMRDADDKLVWTTEPTPGTLNRRVEKRTAPRVTLNASKESAVGEIITLDASDSFATDGSTLTFVWDFGDMLGQGEGSRATYIYLKPGTFTVTLTAADKEGLTTTATHKIKISGEDLLAPSAQTPLLEARPDRSVGGEGGGVRSPKHEPPKQKTTSNPIPIELPIGKSIGAEKTIKKQVLRAGTIRGVVTVPPGVFGKTFGYLDCEFPCAGQGIKIRMTKAEWPVLKKGDVIEVRGKPSTAGGEISFLTKKEAVRVLGAQKVITPRALDIAAPEPTLQNHLVTVSGEVTEKKSKILFLDDGEGEMQVEIASSLKLIGEGDHVTATGVLLEKAGVLKVRASEPIAVDERTPTKKSTTVAIKRDKESERTKYIVTTLAALLALGARPITTLIQKRRKKKDGFTA